MTKVELKRADSLIINDLVEYSPEDFVGLQHGGEGGICLWCDGYLIAFNPVNPVTFDWKLTEGVRWYRNVDYAIFPEFKSIFKSKLNVDVPIIDYSKSETANDVIKFIKEVRQNKKDTTTPI